MRPLGEIRGNLRARMNDAAEQIIIVDTDPTPGIMGQDENDNAAVADGPESLGPGCTKKTLILCHHSRKGGGEGGEAISGWNNRLVLLVDVALEVRRDNTPSRRIIKAHARIIQPTDLLLSTRRQWHPALALGDPAGVGLEEVARRILEVLNHAVGQERRTRARLEENAKAEQRAGPACLDRRGQDGTSRT